MIKKYLKRLILINKQAILMEVLSITGLMRMLMKIRNTDERWGKEEKKEIRIASKKHSEDHSKHRYLFSLRRGLPFAYSC
jgi:hypothetical protein